MNEVHVRSSSSEIVDNSTSTSSWSYPAFDLSPTARFWLLLVFDVPSLICSFALFYHLFIDATSRRSLNNHVIMALLIVGLFSQLIDVPFYLNFTRLGYVWPSAPISCLLWWFAATGISNLTNMLMAWASIERHILVFHDRWFRRKNIKFLTHYLPLITILLYGFIFYLVVLSMYSCENRSAYDSDWCYYPCYYDHDDIALYDTVVNSILPTPVIVVFSLALIFRVIRRKHDFHRRIEWSRHRKMIIQLLSIIALFLLFNLPMTLIVLASLCNFLPDNTAQLVYYAYFLYHYVSLLMPFVCLAALPEIRKSMQRRLGNWIRPNTFVTR